MKKRIIAIFLLLATLLTMCSCESDLERATREAQESRQKAIEARQKVEFLEAILGK